MPPRKSVFNDPIGDIERNIALTDWENLHQLAVSHNLEGMKAVARGWLKNVFEAMTPQPHEMNRDFAIQEIADFAVQYPWGLSPELFRTKRSFSAEKKKVLAKEFIEAKRNDIQELLNYISRD